MSAFIETSLPGRLFMFGMAALGLALAGILAIEKSRVRIAGKSLRRNRRSSYASLSLRSAAGAIKRPGVAMRVFLR